MVVDASEHRTVIVSKRQIQDLLKELNIPIMIYTILYGLFLTHRINYSWKYVNAFDTINKSDGSKVIVYLVVLAFALVFLVPIIAKYQKISRNLKGFMQLTPEIKRDIESTILLLRLSYLINFLLVVASFVPVFVLDLAKHLWILGVIGIFSALLYLLTFKGLNASLIKLKEQKLYSEEPIKQLEISQYITIGAWVLYIILAEVFVLLGIPGQKILGIVFFLTFFTGAMYLMLGLDRWKNRIEYIAD